MEVPALVDAFCAGLRAERPWRNVQGVLLESFRSLGEILALQSRQLAAAELQIAELSKRQEELERKADAVTSAPEDWGLTVANAVEKAVADAHVSWQGVHDERVRDQVVAAVNDRVAELRKDIDEDVAGSMAVRCQAMEESLSQQLKTESSELAGKMETTLLSQVASLDTWLNTLEERMKALETSRSAAQLSLEERLGEFMTEVEQGAARVMFETVETELKQLDERLAKQLASWRQETDRNFDTKVDKGELVKLLSRKMDTLDGWKQLEEKASASRLERVAERLMDAISAVQHAAATDVSELRGLCDAKADAAEFEQLKFGMHDLLAVAESMQSEIASVRALLQSQEVSNASQLATTRDEGALLTDTSAFDTDLLQSVTSQLDAIKRQLRSELYQARYIWKDGAPSTKQTIHWNTQVLNTNSEVFTWKHGSDRIRLLVPGLYHIQASFFTNFAPTVVVRVNGEPAMRLQASSPYPMTPPSTSSSLSRTAGTVQRIHHSAGNVAGLTLDGVFALPANALLCISYDIHERAQGLLNIRKL